MLCVSGCGKSEPGDSSLPTSECSYIIGGDAFSKMLVDVVGSLPQTREDIQFLLTIAFN